MENGEPAAIFWCAWVTPRHPIRRSGKLSVPKSVQKRLLTHPVSGRFVLGFASLINSLTSGKKRLNISKSAGTFKEPRPYGERRLSRQPRSPPESAWFRGITLCSSAAPLPALAPVPLRSGAVVRLRCRRPLRRPRCTYDSPHLAPTTPCCRVDTQHHR